MQRDEHMNHLVYKTKNPYMDMEDDKENDSMRPPQNMQTSAVLFKRLSNKGPISNSSKCSLLDSGRDNRGSARSVNTNRTAPNFQQWVRAKDAEKRLKKKLLAETKREIRQELLEFAKNEKDVHDSRVGQMEGWLTKKKLNEAYKITQLRHDGKRQHDIEQDESMGDNVRNYKMWMQQKSMQDRYEQMERARMAQLQMEAQLQEEARMGVQAQINQQNYMGLQMEDEMDDEFEDNY